MEIDPEFVGVERLSGFLAEMLKGFAYVKADAALMLGLKRTTLLARMKKLNIN